MTERREAKAHPIRELLVFWDDEFKAHTGTRYPFNGGKDSKLIQGLREMYSDDELKSFMRAFFEMDDPFFEEAGHSLGAFRSCLPKVIQFVKRGSTRKPTRMESVVNHNVAVLEDLTGRKLRRVQ